MGRSKKRGVRKPKKAPALSAEKAALAKKMFASVTPTTTQDNAGRPPPVPAKPANLNTSKTTTTTNADVAKAKTSSESGSTPNSVPVSVPPAHRVSAATAQTLKCTKKVASQPTPVVEGASGTVTGTVTKCDKLPVALATTRTLVDMKKTRDKVTGDEIYEPVFADGEEGDIAPLDLSVKKADSAAKVAQQLALIKKTTVDIAKWVETLDDKGKKQELRKYTKKLMEADKKLKDAGLGLDVAVNLDPSIPKQKQENAYAVPPPSERSSFSEQSSDFEIVPRKVHPASQSHEEDYEDDSSSSSDSDEDEGPAVYSACEDCRKDRCSNCLVHFKRGDQMVTKIPTLEETTVPLEVAVICVFDPTAPYLKWLRAKAIYQDDSSSSKIFSGEDGMAEVDDYFRFLHGLDSDSPLREANDEDEKDVAAAQAEYRQVAEWVKQIVERYGKEYQSIREVWTYEQRLDLIKTMVVELQDLCPMEDQPEDDVRLNRIAKSILGYVEAEAIRKILLSNLGAQTDAIISVILNKNWKLPHFQFCMGCAQLVSVFYMNWQRWQKGTLPEQGYYAAVLCAFEMAERAKEKVLGGSRKGMGRRLHVLKKYGSEQHSSTCGGGGKKGKNAKSEEKNKKQNPNGTKFAVGYLMTCLQEGYLRVFNEVITKVADGE